MKAKSLNAQSFFRHGRLLAVWVVILALLAAGCGPVADIIGEREPPTPTPDPLDPTRQAVIQATPGGKLSVWLVTPTGASGEAGSAATPQVGEIPGANPVGPNATATADFATREAATAIALAPPPAPNYQPDECPQPGSPSPPARPQDFDDYKRVIGQYLSAGGSSTVLEAALRNWSAITDRGGVVQADMDLTGDGVREIIVTLYNPAAYNPEALLNAGQLLVYGCDSGGYRLLYTTQYNAGIALPRLLRVGDMNADVRAELVYYTESCDRSTCYKEAKILSWNAVVGVFEELNNGQIVAVNGRIGVADIDEDGVLELTAQVNPPGTVASGPPRSVLDTWDWNGVDYVLARRDQEEARYRIQAVHDADQLLDERQWRAAINAYAALRDDNSLSAWNVSGDYEGLRAYAAFKIMITYALMGNGRADTWFNVLQQENPPGSAGHGFAQMGATFMDNFRATGDAHAACAQALSAGGMQPNTLSLLNSYGYNNRSYMLSDLCPF